MYKSRNLTQTTTQLLTQLLVGFYKRRLSKRLFRGKVEKHTHLSLRQLRIRKYVNIHPTQTMHLGFIGAPEWSGTYGYKLIPKNVSLKPAYKTAPLLTVAKLVLTHYKPKKYCADCLSAEFKHPVSQPKQSTIIMSLRRRVKLKFNLLKLLFTNEVSSSIATKALYFPIVTGIRATTNPLGSSGKTKYNYEHLS